MRPLLNEWTSKKKIFYLLNIKQYGILIVLYSITINKGIDMKKEILELINPLSISERIKLIKEIAIELEEELTICEE